MDIALASPADRTEQNRRIALTVQRERARLLRYIRRRIADAADAEDILQDAFYELLEASRVAEPIEQVGAWLRRVVSNRIIDRFRSRAVRGQNVQPAQDESGSLLAELLPDPDGDPHTQLLRARLLGEVEAALQELPQEQREVFLAHELEGVTFRQLAARSGLSINTLLARKHYATRFLRRRLEATWADWFQN